MEKGEVTCERLLRAGEQTGCHVQVEILQARSAGVAIVGEAINRSADLIVMGVSLERKFGELEIPERDTHVLKHAPCQVWLVREPLTNGNGNKK
jgi:nucleotide-binding universal stress UspA family protein